MNKEELLARLKDIEFGEDNGDEEAQHIKADKALLEYINDTDITEAFESIPKWYA